ncbi:MAG TPA: M56 family metallopeptidase [Dongiaceae bacterium]|nr:M56 family metallopeptidase [Dongiaceae bacterium]
MYFIRGGVIAMSVFVLVYVALSLLVGAGWRALHRDRRRVSSATAYGFRILPLVAAIVVVALFTVPSFLRFEPRWDDEPIGIAALALASAGAAILIFGIVKALLAWIQTSRCVSSWTSDSRTLNLETAVPAFQTPESAPLLAVAGLCRPKLLISGCARRLLDPGELEAAVRHELAHVRRRDNLKKLLLRACAFPFLDALDRAWLEAAEINADDEAVQDERSALDLASALLKVSRLAPRVRGPELAMDLVSGAPGAVTARVEWLLSWTPQARPRRRLIPIGVPAALVAAVAAGLAYMWVLARVHQFTELLVR